uniref:RRM domain-containing protein n=1 Tax=Panagrolaimus sp. JU765 TaxID=591449 RepID=A0AC34QJJ9_9BILA
MGSRIYIKNLPQRLYDEQKIKNIFKEYGQITDVVLLGKNTGKSAGSAFVGFATPEAASNAIKKRNNTYVGTVKLNIEYARQTNLKRKAEDEPDGKNAKKIKNEKSEKEKTGFPEEDLEETFEGIRKNGRLCIRNLAHCCTEDDLRGLIGDVPTKELRCIVDQNTGECKGLAYVQFVDVDDAITAFETLKQKEFMGRYLKVFSCDDAKIQHPQRSFTKKLPYTPKSLTDQGTKSWNALFVGADTIAEVFSKKLEIQKSQLLTAESKLSPLVALAIAEMRILQQIREFLVKNEINIYSFGEDVPRSRKVLIVKNLPHPMEAEEIKRIFSKFGQIRRFIYDEDLGLTCILEYTESSAQKCFEKMNGSMLRRRPLKLEYAPSTIFEKPPSRELLRSEVMQRIIRLAKENLSGDGLNLPDLIASTILVTFSTADIKSDYDLRKIFPNQKNKIVGCGIMTEQQPKAGFIFFQNKEIADEAIKDKKVTARLQEILSVEIATEEAIISGERSSTRTILVKNLPFSVQEKEIKNLFEVVGPIKEIRLPVKFTGEKKGFAFIEYENPGDIQKALEMFEGVHFSGRRMVLLISQVKETIKEGKTTMKKRQQMPPKTVVAPEDQMKINTFARLYDREPEIELMKKTLLDLEDAELGILEVTDDKIPFMYGLAFIMEKSDNVSSLVEKRQNEAKEQQSKAEDDLDTVQQEMKRLRSELYATFGDNISLEADEE